MKDLALSHRMAHSSMDYVDEGNLILFPEATHRVQHDAANQFPCDSQNQAQENQNNHDQQILIPKNQSILAQ
jgi:hypothetical protein